MIRYLELYKYFLRFSFSKATQFRLDFFFRIFMDIVYYAVNLSFYKILFLHSGMIGGWSESQVRLFVGSYLLIDAVEMTVFSTNLFWLPQFINKGDLDFYLVRPVSPLFFLSVREFAVNSFVNFIMAFAIWIWALVEYDGVFHILPFALYLLSLLGGIFLYYALRILLILPAFWTHSPRGLDGLFWGMVPCMERPDIIFRGWTRTLVTMIIPFSIIASFPARLLWETSPLSIFIHILGVNLVFAVMLRFFWKLALKNYAGASS